jgi:glutathione S-transferase
LSLLVSAVLVYCIPYSTNVERVALAAAYKGVEIDWVDVDPADRSAVREVSGQELVPVLVVDGEVVSDSPRVLAWLETRYPDPPLWPRDPARRVEAAIFVEWFNRILVERQPIGERHPRLAAWVDRVDTRPRA